MRVGRFLGRRDAPGSVFALGGFIAPPELGKEENGGVDALVRPDSGTVVRG
jgi:hypothetical protein